MKTTLDGINGRLDITEEKTIAFENTEVESNQNVTRRKKEIQK